MGKCKTTVWSRVTGFFQPVENYNPGKKEEVKDRKMFNFEGVRDGETKGEIKQP